MKVSTLALAASLAAVTSPAAAQYSQPQTQPQAQPQQDEPRNERRERRQRGERQAPGQQLSREEIAAVQPLQTAVNAQDWTAAAAALPAAQTAATSPYGRFVVGRFQLQIGQGTQNQQMQIQAVDAMLASGAAPAEFVQTLVGARASFAIQASDWPTAEQMLTRFTDAAPNDLERLRQLAEVKIQLGKNAEALTLYQRLLQAAEAGGQPAPAEYYTRTAALLLDQRQEGPWLEFSRRMLRAYPTADNWRETLVRYRQMAGEDAALGLDVRRLMRVAHAFSRPGDYIEFADRLGRAGLPNEQKTLLEEGISRGVITAGDSTARQMIAQANERIAEDRPTLARSRTQALAGTGRQARIMGDAYYAYGQYADAAELYRAALQKGGEDAGMVNTRLGAALALGGQRAEAEAAFRAVSGSYANLAQLWLAWLERPATAA
ncbi:MAG: tetratricopeptide repeat protein [Sphingosinicella sp.]|uniref:tetratricopeptide repeat protein n=1 Tax=Sphingosinicella sp. TaxID=1917971 RepID=UPI0040379B3A